MPEVFGLFGKDGSDSSSLTQGNLSSSQIAFCGANGAGSSSDAIVTSTVSESLVSSKNKCVPQHAAKQRIRFACAILRGSPRVMDKSSRGYRSPGDIGRAGASPAIDAMTIDQRKRPTLQHVSRPAANASTSELHKIRLAHSNHEFQPSYFLISTSLWSLTAALLFPAAFSPQITQIFTDHKRIRKLATGRVRSIVGPGSQENSVAASKFRPSSFLLRTSLW